MVLALDAENEKLRVAMQTLKEMIFGQALGAARVIVASSSRRSWYRAGRSRHRRHAACAGERRYACDEAAREPTQEARRNIGALPKHLPRCEQVLSRTRRVPVLRGPAAQDRRGVSEVLDVIRESCGTAHDPSQNSLPRCTDGVGSEGAAATIESGMASTRS